MTRQKRGFLLFICSLFPGAGEMYMGFFKQGISIMLVFWGTIAVAGYAGIEFLIMFLPILWFYSFFNVHNLKSLSEEDFYAVEDTYILHLDQFISNTDYFTKKYTKLVAAVLIFFGVSILWDNLGNGLFWLLPSAITNALSSIFYRIPSIIIGIAIIAAGVHLLKTKKEELDNQETYQNSQKEEEHYWEPYRPYQQTRDTEPQAADTPKAAVTLEPVTAEASVQKELEASAASEITPEAENSSSQEASSDTKNMP